MNLQQIWKNIDLRGGHTRRVNTYLKRGHTRRVVMKSKKKNTSDKLQMLQCCYAGKRKRFHALVWSCRERRLVIVAQQWWGEVQASLCREEEAVVIVGWSHCARKMKLLLWSAKGSNSHKLQWRWTSKGKAWCLWAAVWVFGQEKCYLYHSFYGTPFDISPIHH